jgi:hypothetical protein
LKPAFGIKLFASMAKALCSCGILENGMANNGAGGAAACTDDIRGESFYLEQVYLVSVNIPLEAAEDGSVDSVKNVLDSIMAAVPLTYGKYDGVAFRSSPGTEQFRPCAGSRAGQQQARSECRTVRVSFSIPRDANALRNTIEAIHRAHSYEEPVIDVQQGWSSRATGAKHDDNPDKWWNRKDRRTDVRMQATPDR